VQRDDDEFEVVWNGTKDKLATCPSLTGYTGPSTLTAWSHVEGLEYGDQDVLNKALGLGRYRRPRRARKYDDLVVKKEAA
jgi:hypothetical protein